LQIKPFSAELTTERNSKIVRNSQLNNNKNVTARIANKIMTEADENHQGLDPKFVNLNPMKSKTNLSRLLMSGYDNESESNDRIISLNNVVDKAPKMNLEVKFY
jgi:hypothetical protein